VYHDGSNKKENWKAKDSVVYLLTAVATRGSATQVLVATAGREVLSGYMEFFLFSGKHGVTSTNALVDVVKSFSDYVFEDLQAALGTVNPSLEPGRDPLGPSYLFYLSSTSFCPAAPCPSPSFRKLCRLYLRRYHYRSDFVHQAKKMHCCDYFSTFTYRKSFMT
jgi:hypothetical protein